MLLGNIPTVSRSLLAKALPAIEGKRVVVGGSGNFEVEAMLSKANVLRVSSSDTGLFPVLAGRFLTGNPVDYDLSDDLAFVRPLLTSDLTRLAAIPALLQMAQHAKRDTAYSRLMWDRFVKQMPGLVRSNAAKISGLDLRLDEFHEGAILPHFRKFEADEDAVFVVYGARPTNDGSKPLLSMMSWDGPEPVPLSKERGELARFLTGKRFLWFTDKEDMPGMEPVAAHAAGRTRTTFLYSGGLDLGTAYVNDRPKGGEVPKWLPLMRHEDEIRKNSRIWLHQIKTTELAAFKEAYLGRNVLFGSGNWAFAVMVDGRAMGFIEYAPSKYGAIDGMYLMADFPVPETRYVHAARLMAMIAVSGESAKAVRRLRQMEVRTLATTAFTENPVSMKYRGVLELVKRGQDKDGKKFLNYEAPFNDLTWKKTLNQWLNKHGSATR